MTEQVHQDNEVTYRNFIEGAYLDPIRTVTLVDDDFPTIDALINRENRRSLFEEGEKESAEDALRWKNKDFSLLADLIRLCRTHEPSWGVDVYDGQTPTIPDCNHIQHSDLIILDYHLEPEAENPGKNAQQFLRKLSTNNHFNLVVIHTKGVDGDIEEVFQETLASLLTLSIEDSPSETKLEELDDFFDALQINDPALFQRLIEAGSELDAIGIFQSNQIVQALHSPKGIYHPERDDLIKAIKENPNLAINDVIWWLLRFKLKTLVGLEILEKFDGQITDWSFDGEYNWIASGKIFVTVIKKTSTSEEVGKIPSKLIDALEKSNPSPLLLIMARMRYELEERGLLEAESITANEELQIAWLYKLLSADEFEKDSACNRILEKHWDSLSTATKPELRKFSKEMLNTFDGGILDTLKTFFSAKVLARSQQAVCAYNIHSCSIDVTSPHLVTGHILEIALAQEPEGEQAEKEYWMCLSPACDLVPGREKTGWAKKVGTACSPFKAVLLDPVNARAAIESVHSNNYIFLSIDGENKCFEVPHGKSKHPQWEQMFAKNEGRIAKGAIALLRVVDDTHGSIEFQETSDVRVVGELRYEYALNFLHRLGGTLSRIGLDYEKSLWEVGS